MGGVEEISSVPTPFVSIAAYSHVRSREIRAGHWLYLPHCNRRSGTCILTEVDEVCNAFGCGFGTLYSVEEQLGSDRLDLDFLEMFEDATSRFEPSPHLQGSDGRPGAARGNPSARLPLRAI